VGGFVGGEPGMQSLGLKKGGKREQGWAKQDSLRKEEEASRSPFFKTSTNHPDLEKKGLFRAARKGKVRSRGKRNDPGGEGYLLS